MLKPYWYLSTMGPPVLTDVTERYLRIYQSLVVSMQIPAFTLTFRLRQDTLVSRATDHVATCPRVKGI